MPIRLLWIFFGFSMHLVGIPMDLLMSYGIPVDFLWAAYSYGYSLGFLCVSHGIPLVNVAGTPHTNYVTRNTSKRV